jgi:hypothetical protein
MTAPAPSGVVTFLFTDIEGSTRRWEADADAMPGGVHLFTCAPIGAWEEPASNPRHRSLTTVRDDDERSRRDDVSQNCPRRGEFDRPVSEKTAG